MTKRLLAAAVVLALVHSTAEAKVVLDLTATGSTATGTAVIGGQFRLSQTTEQPAGSGVINPFLRLNRPNGNTDFERAFNTDVGVFLDTQPPVGPGQFTHALRLADIPIVPILGVDYLEFLLDVNQENNGPLSLNQIQIFQSDTDLGNSAFTLQEADADQDAVIAFGALTPKFQLNFQQNTLGSLATNTEIQADSGAGSGVGDLFIYVRNSLFTQTPTSFITFFAQLGTDTGAFAANDGYEEFGVQRGPIVQAVPEPATLGSAAIAGLFGLACAWRRRRRIVS